MKKIKVVFILIFLSFTFLLTGCNFLNDDKLGEDEIKVSNSESSFVGTNYENVVSKLQELGFTNIESVPVYDIVWGFTKSGTTKSVTINGKKNFKKGDVFNKNAVVIVTYSMPVDDDPGDQNLPGENEAKVLNDEYSLTGKPFEDVVNTLEGWGFTNIESVPVYDIVWGVTSPGSTKNVTIDGSTNFKKGDIFNKNISIIVTYSMPVDDDPLKQNYTVKWLYDDGTVIKTDKLKWGDMPSYKGEPPFKESTNEKRYTFVGWNPEIVVVNSDQTYTAVFNEEDNVFTIEWHNYNGEILEIDTRVPYGVMPSYDGPVPIRQEDDYNQYVFSKWEPDIYSATKDQVYTALFNEIPKIVTVTILNWDESILIDSDYNYEEEVIEPILSERAGYKFAGWASEDGKIEFPLIATKNITIYALWYVEFDMVQVGELNEKYIIPTGTGDFGRESVNGGYYIATTITTYELWYQVRIWAEANGYIFQNKGREGDRGVIGAAPTENKLEPATYISWRDVVIWTNALSEMEGLQPVYRTSNGTIIKDSSNNNAEQVDLAIQTKNNGYRLPTASEWEMAARWKNDIVTTDGSIFVDGRYWTPGSYASGATANHYHEGETRAVAWFTYGVGDSRNHTRPVAMLLPNHLGIYDMSGNVREWTYTASENFSRILKGGGYFFYSSVVQIGENLESAVTAGSQSTGFRLVRD